jgi:hypothetical protein
MQTVKLNKEEIYFKFREHPGDFFRNTDVVKLPNPNTDLESFLVFFLNRYQSDERVSSINDFYKLLHNEIEDESEKQNLIDEFNIKSINQIKEEINLIELQLKNEAYMNFYKFVNENRIEIIYDYEK